MNALSFRLGWPLYAGMLVAGAAAVVASASTLAALAHAAGWSSWTPWLLPAALDIGGSAGGWCWLRPGVPDRARRFGRIVALAGAGGSLIGNAAGHLLATHYLTPGPVLVVVVGAVPAAVLVALAHLAALLAAAQEGITQEPAHDNPEQRDGKGEGRTPAEHQQNKDEQPHEMDDEHRDQASPAPEDTRKTVLQLLTQHPLTIAELATATGRSRTTVIGHLTALTQSGAIRRDEDKRYRAITRPRLVNQSEDQSNAGRNNASAATTSTQSDRAADKPSHTGQAANSPANSKPEEAAR